MRYSTAEGCVCVSYFKPRSFGISWCVFVCLFYSVEFYGEAEGAWGDVEEQVGGWRAQNYWDEDSAQPQQVALRPGRKRSRQATDNGTYVARARARASNGSVCTMTL